MKTIENFKPIPKDILKRGAAIGVAAGIILSFSPSQKVLSDEKNLPCSSPIATKLHGSSERNNGEAGIKRLLIQNNKEKFFIFSIPYSRADGWSKDPWANTDTNTLATDILKKKNLIPQLLVIDDTSANYSGKLYEQYEKVIVESVKKHQSLGTFSASLEDKKISVEFKPTKEIGNTDLTLEAYVYRNHVWINPPNKNGQVHHDRILIELPLGVEGKKVKLNRNGLIEEEFIIKRLTKEFENQAGVLMVIKKAGKTIGTGLFEFAKAQGIEKPIYLNWNNRPENTLNLDDPNLMSKPEFLEKTGLKPFNLVLKEVKNLKKIKFRLHYPQNEKENYAILAMKTRDEYKDKVDVKINNKVYEYEVVFKEAFTGPELNLLDVYLHLKRDNQETSSGMEFAEISLTDKDGNELYWDMNNIQQYYPNQLNIEKNPFDLTNDASIDNEDRDLLLTVFGSQEGDKDWQPEYDVYKEGVSQGRIDIADVTAIIKEIREQDKLRQAIKTANPEIQLPELEIQIEKIMPPFQLTKNEEINEQTIGRWLEKRKS